MTTSQTLYITLRPIQLGDTFSEHWKSVCGLLRDHSDGHMLDLSANGGELLVALPRDYDMGRAHMLSRQFEGVRNKNGHIAFEASVGFRSAPLPTALALPA